MNRAWNLYVVPTVELMEIRSDSILTSSPSIIEDYENNVIFDGNLE